MQFAFSAPQRDYPLTFAEEASKVVNIALRLAPALQRAFLEAILTAGKGLSVAEIESAIRLGGIDAAIGFRVFELAFKSSSTPLLLEAYRRAGQAEAGKIGVAGLRFDLVNPRAVEWVEGHAAELVKGITDESRLAIRTILRRSFVEGITPEVAARQIRPLIGLTERSAIAVQNYRKGLVAAGRKPADVERLVARQSRIYLNQRARLIAVNETLIASHEGQRELWRQGTAKGLIDSTRARKKWLMSPSPCPSACAPMQGQQVAIDQQFITGRGDSIDGPPAHVKCKCSQGLTFSE